MSNDLKKWTNLQTIRRLPMYYHFLKRVRAEGNEFISSSTIAREMGLEAIVVRKDLAIERSLGRPRIGYRIDELTEMIEDFLGWNNTTHAFLAGVGNLGSALLGYDGMASYGLKIVAAFDTDPAKVGAKMHDVEVQAMGKLVDLGRRRHVKLGILCVPAPAAQSVAESMAAAGIEGIWNFTPVRLQVPEGVIVQREDLAAGLAMLSYKLPRRKTSGEQAVQGPVEVRVGDDASPRNNTSPRNKGRSNEEAPTPAVSVAGLST